MSNGSITKELTRVLEDGRARVLTWYCVGIEKGRFSRIHFGKT